MLDSRECYGCGETGHIRRNCPKQSYRPPIASGEVVMEEAVILEDAVVEVMVVTKTVGVMGKLEPPHHNMVGATDR